MNDHFYGLGFFEIPVLNYFKYRGKGRPRREDYTTVFEIERELNRHMNVYLDNQKQTERR